MLRCNNELSNDGQPIQTLAKPPPGRSNEAGGGFFDAGWNV
jgi:hypothetical protein